MDAQKNRAPFSFIVSTKDTHDLNALTLFNERVARLNRSRLAECMRDPNYVFLYDPFMNREWICADGIDEDTVDVFILNVRLLIQDNYGFLIKCLAENIYSESAVSDDLRDRFRNTERIYLTMQKFASENHRNLAELDGLFR